MDRERGVCLFGGAFDPPHLTHRRLAAEVPAALGVDRFVVLPAGDHPFKGSAGLAPAAHRLAMCELAFAGLAGVSVDDREIRRSGPSYTVDTLRSFRAELPADTRLYWLIGSDNIESLHRWREHHAILELATVVTFPRVGHPVDPAQLESVDLTEDERASLVAHVLDGEPDASSATAVRAALARGECPPELPPAVADYIAAHSLYG